MSNGQPVPTPSLRKASRGAVSLRQGSLGPHSAPGLLPVGHQWAERGPEEAGPGGDAGPLRGVLSCFSALLHTHQLPHPLLLFSSLARHQQVSERPRPQSPCGRCGREGGPHHSCPFHIHCLGPHGPQHPTAHRWVPSYSPSCPALSHFRPESLPLSVMCDDVGASALGRAGAWLLE